MNEEELKKEGLRSIKEFDLAWQEFFKNKPKPQNEEEDKKQQEEFYHWYNYIRKQSDTNKTPAEMHKEVYGEDPKNIFDKSSRFMNFEWDENYNEGGERNNEESLNELNKIADYMFDSGVWPNSKEQMKDMSKKDSSKNMFRLGFYMSYRYIHEQMKDIEKELKEMSKEEIQDLIKNIEKD